MTGDASDWDRDLTPAEVKRLPPKVRGQRVRAALERKVAVLEQRAAGSPGERAEPVPWSRAALRRWHDAGLGLWRWAWPALDALDGPYADLIQRYRSALARLRARSRARRGDTPGEAERLLLTVDRLRRQNEQLVEEVRVLQRRLATPVIVRR